MIDELEDLRPEVREALIDFDSWMGSFEYADGELPRERFCIIRAELLRLAGERDELRTAYTSASQSRDYWKECAGRASSDLASLKARIEEAPVVTINDSGHIIGDGYVPSLRGKHARLVVEG